MVDLARRHAVTVSGPVGADPIVFVHGFGCDQTAWRHVAPAFQAEHRVHLVDLIGAGASDLTAYDPERHASLAGYADDLVELLDDLDLTHVTFVGHSVAAVIGARASLLRPERFARLVMVGPSPRYLDDEGYVGGFTEADITELLEALDSNYLGWSAAMAPAIMGNPERPELGEDLVASFCRTDPAIARRFARATFLSDDRDILRQVTTPTLVLQCRDDAIAPLAVGDWVHEAIAGSELVVLDATGHCPHLSAPVETTAAIAAFLRR